jgi:phosphatidylinositol-3-phosphatase
MKQRSALPAICCILLALAAFGCGGTSHTNSAPAPSPSPLPVNLTPPDHVFLIVLENHSFSEVLGGGAMPFLRSLATQHGVAANYFANTHPSIGNYFMLTSGQIVTNDDSFTGTVADDNIARALGGAGKTWKAYMESLPSVGYLGPDVYPYFKRHNPFAYFSDVLNSPALASNIVPFPQLFGDLSAAALPQFAYIVPNVENSAHDCPGGGTACTDTDKLAAADRWLQANIGPLINNPSLVNSVFIITWDESVDTDLANGGGQVATVLVGAHVKQAFTSGTFFQHQSTLRLILELLRVNDFPGSSAGAPQMGGFFQ